MPLTITMTLQARAKLAFILPYLGSSHEDSEAFTDVIAEIEPTPEELIILKATPLEDAEGNPTGYRWFQGANDATLMAKSISLGRAEAKKLEKFLREATVFKVSDISWRKPLIADLEAATK